MNWRTYLISLFSDWLRDKKQLANGVSQTVVTNCRQGDAWSLPTVADDLNDFGMFTASQSSIENAI